MSTLGNNLGDDALRKAAFQPIDVHSESAVARDDPISAFVEKLAKTDDAVAIFEEICTKGVDPFAVLAGATGEEPSPLLENALAKAVINVKTPDELALFCEEAINAGSSVALEVYSLLLQKATTPTEIMEVLHSASNLGLDPHEVVALTSAILDESKMAVLDQGASCFAIQTGDKSALFARIVEKEDPKKELAALMQLPALTPNSPVMKETVTSVSLAYDLTTTDLEELLQDRTISALDCKDALDYVGDDEFKTSVSQALFNRAVSNTDMGEAVTALRLGADFTGIDTDFEAEAEKYDLLYQHIEENKTVDISKALHSFSNPEAAVHTMMEILGNSAPPEEKEALLTGLAINCGLNGKIVLPFCQKHDVDYISVMQQACKKTKETPKILDICTQHLREAGNVSTEVQARLLVLLENHIDTQTVIDKAVSQGSDRAFLQTELHVAKLAFAIEKNNKGLLVAESHRGGKAAIEAAKELLTRLGKPVEPEVAAQAAPAESNGKMQTLAKELSQAVIQNDTATIESLYKQAASHPNTIETFFDQVITDLTKQKMASPAGLKTFWKVALQSASEQKNFSHLQQLLQDFPKLQALGLDSTPHTLFQEAIGGSDETVTFMKMVLADFEAVSQVPYERHRLHPLDIFRISVFVHKELEENSSREDVAYLSGKTTGLPRGILIDFEKHSFSILSKKAGALQAAGKFKKVTDTVFVTRNAPSDITPEARRFVRITTKPKDPNRGQEPISQQELDYEKQYGGAHLLTRYGSSKRAGEEKLTYIQEAFEHPDLDSFIQKLQEHPETAYAHTLDGFLSIGSQITNMHNNGDIHNDLKTANVMARAEVSGWKVRVADFGFSFKPMDGQSYPFYGTAEYTSPEYLSQVSYGASIVEQGAEKYTEQVKANDLFAIGCMLYEVTNKETVPWASAMGSYTREEYKAMMQGREPDGNDERRLEIQESLSSSIAALKETATTDPQYGFKMVCTYLLEPDPQKRLTAEQYTTSMQLCQELAAKQITPDEFTQKLDAFVAQNTSQT